jgi:hypothetical protein
VTAEHRTYPLNGEGDFVTHEYLVPGINPEPWAIGPITSRKMIGGKRGVPFVGPNETLTTYQQALVAELQALPNPVALINGTSELELFFWRRLDRYEFDSGKKHQRHIADTTNLIKGTEDALQGLLFPNDRQNVVVHGHIVEQGPDTNPGLIILHRAHDNYWPGEEHVAASWARIRAAANTAPDLGNLF